MKKLFVLLLAISSYGHASICDNIDLENYPSLSQGRVKTVYVLANETINRIANKQTKKQGSSLDIFCKLSLNGDSKIILKTDVKHIKLKKLIRSETPTYHELLQKRELIKAEILSLKVNDSYKKALLKLLSKIDLYKNTISGTLWTFYQKDQWRPISDIRDMDDKEIQVILNKSKNDFDDAFNNNYLKENIIKKFHIFSIVMLLTLLAVLLSVVFKNQFHCIVMTILAISLEAYVIGLRVLISQRAPITNMYETVMFSGFGAILIGLILFRLKKDKVFLIGGLSYNVMCLFMMKFSGGLLDESISPLVPVLRDNFWLSTHVTTIILSYAAFALSWMLSNFALIKRRWFKLSKEQYRHYEEIVYSCLKVGVILLSAGIILGGIWADYSWGRFWGLVTFFKKNKTKNAL